VHHPLYPGSGSGNELKKDREMSLRYTVGEGWDFVPDGLCSVGGGGNSSNQSSQGSGWSAGATNPENLQNSAFVNSAPTTAGLLNGIVQSGGFDAGGVNTITANMANPFTFSNGYGSTSGPNNPLVAPITAPQNQTLGQIGSFAQGLPGSLGGAFTSLQSELDPNFAANLATSAPTLAAINSAISPIRTQFNTQTVPGLDSSFTQAGQRIGSASGIGSSAFDASFGNAQAQEQATEAATAGSIANNAYQTGLNIQANAPAQLGNLTTSELGNLVTSLNAQALPQLTQQYGINAGAQLYQQQMATVLQALGLSVQGEQPAIGYSGWNNSASWNSSKGSSGGVNFGISPSVLSQNK
jgi:hypothetical protein